MICNKCGNKCSDNVKFCPTCGNDFSTMSQQPQYNNMQSQPSYNQPQYNIPNQPINNQPPVYNPQPMYNNGMYFQPQKKSGSGCVIALVIVIVLGVLFFVAMYLIGITAIKSAMGSSNIEGDWYCSKSSDVSSLNASTHVTFKSDRNFVWAKNNDELNNYYSGNYTIIKSDDKYEVSLYVSDAKTNGTYDSQYDKVTFEYDFTTNGNSGTFYNTNSSGTTWYCVKKSQNKK